MTIGRSTLALLLWACGCGISASGRSQLPKQERNVITREEILNSSFMEKDLYQAIRGLRPHFLSPPAGVRSRASTASSPPAVYVDGMRQAGLDALRTLRTSEVEEVRYLTPTAAQSELGSAASGGALMIKLHRP